LQICQANRVRLHVGLRAIVSLPLGLFITFFQAHGPDVGLIMLAAFSGAMALGNLAFLLAKQQTMAEATSTLAYLPVLLLSLLSPPRYPGRLETCVQMRIFLFDHGVQNP